MDAPYSMPDVTRQTGRTARQMREAPQGAVFVWCNNRTDYPRQLARRIGRADLDIISPETLERGDRTRGRTHVVFDHAFSAYATTRQLELRAIYEARERARGS